MPDVLIRDLDPETVELLKTRAERQDRSMQSELKRILEEVAETERKAEEAWDRIDQFRERLEASGREFSDSAELIREDRYE